MNKKGNFIGIFIFIIFTLVFVVFAVVFTYIGDTTETRLKQVLGDRDFGHNTDTNATIEDTFGDVNVAYGSLPWIAMFMVGGQILGIMIGSYLVTTKPVFFIPYIFFMIIAVFVSVGISNAYEMLISNATLSGTFAEFNAVNIVMLNLPLICTIVGFLGAIIMFTQLGKGLKYAG